MPEDENKAIGPLWRKRFLKISATIKYNAGPFFIKIYKK
jgi:hypothetical protein